ncbi:MAG TPA: hypothetical protein QF499_04180 [Gammaproteobacteria bacterium]|nr:hypothetical protein [Chromatiales bacterium]HJP38315.1 hypothetical protein [Gammaproteobacteria bacterium]
MLTLLPVLIISACSNSLSFEATTEMPVPLATPMPATVGIYYPEGFSDYVYRENTDDRKNWDIQTGASQTAVFDRLLSSMFDHTVHIEDLNQPDRQLDGIFSPELVTMQFAMPKETSTDIYEAWVKYDLRLFDSTGLLLAKWLITGYGKTSTEFHSNPVDGLNHAIGLAFRDAGSKLLLGFRANVEVQTWLAATGIACDNGADGCRP